MASCVKMLNYYLKNDYNSSILIMQHGRGGAERGEEHDPANCLPLHLKHKQGEINTENAIQNKNKGGIKHYQGDNK